MRFATGIYEWQLTANGYMLYLTQFTRGRPAREHCGHLENAEWWTVESQIALVRL